MGQSQEDKIRELAADLKRDWEGPIIQKGDWEGLATDILLKMTSREIQIRSEQLKKSDAFKKKISAALSRLRKNLSNIDENYHG